MHVTASAPIIAGTTPHSQAFANSAGPARNESLAAGIQAASYATATPSVADVNAALSSASNVSTALNGGGNNVLGLLTLSLNNLHTGSLNAYHIESDWSVTLADIADLAKPLIAGLTSASSTGDGTVTFAINLNNAEPAISQSFSILRTRLHTSAMIQ